MLRLLLFVTLTVATMAGEVEDGNLLAAATNQFTAKMFSEVVKSQPDKSVILSAFSVMPPLAQLGIASVGESHDELLASIGMPNNNVTRAVFSQLSNKLKSSKDITLQMAARIYVAKSYNLNKDFADFSRHVFNSEAKNIDFIKNTESAAEMNAWVEDQTNHRITNLVDPRNLDADTRAVLLNAIYFKGTWQTPFSKYSTKDGDFHVSKDKVIKVPTMYVRNDFKYTFNRELNAQVIELPYNGNEASMIIVLPKEIDGMNDLVKKLENPSILDEVTKKMRKVEVEVYLPKFKIETTTDLKEVLQKINVEKIFTPEARLENLIEGENNLYISDAVQKAFIEVNEEGAEATAANGFYGAVVYSAVVNPYRPPVFRADHPFYYQIKVKDLTLFSGLKSD